MRFVTHFRRNGAYNLGKLTDFSLSGPETTKPHNDTAPLTDTNAEVERLHDEK
jgi:hypothetical protein